MGVDVVGDGPSEKSEGFGASGMGDSALGIEVSGNGASEASGE